MVICNKKQPPFNEQLEMLNSVSIHGRNNRIPATDIYATSGEMFQLCMNEIFESRNKFPYSQRQFFTSTFLKLVYHTRLKASIPRSKSFGNASKTFPAPYISKSCSKIKINSNFYFCTTLWCLKNFCEGLIGLYKNFWVTKKKCENKSLS